MEKIKSINFAVGDRSFVNNKTAGWSAQRDARGTPRVAPCTTATTIESSVHATTTSSCPGMAQCSACWEDQKGLREVVGLSLHCAKLGIESQLGVGKRRNKSN